MENRDTKQQYSGIVYLKYHRSIDDKVLMTNVNFDETFEIFLFTEELEQNNFSKLSEFISFLKFNKVNLPYKFSYVGRGDSLIPELSLNENILMDFSPNSLTASRDFQFQEFLKEGPNQELQRLYQKIASPHEMPSDSDAQMRKITSLIKALIFEGQFIFLEEPEKNLDKEGLDLFISSLKDHIARHKQNVFIFSNHLDLWMPHSHQHVKREKDYSFTIYEVSKNWQWQKERRAFYGAEKVENDRKNILNFNLPKNTEAKNTKKNSSKKSAS